MEDLLDLLNMLTSNDTATINAANKIFTEQYENKTIKIPLLCQVLFTKPTPHQASMLTSQEKHRLLHNRQLSGILLRKVIRKKKTWNELNPYERRFIKEGLVKAMISEGESLVRKEMIQVIAKIMYLETDEPWFCEILNHSLMLCLEADADRRMLGAKIFVTLSEASCQYFKPHITNVLTMFYTALKQCEIEGNFVSPSLFKIYSAMVHVMGIANIMGNPQKEKMIEQIIPIFMRALRQYAIAPRGTTDIEHYFGLLEVLAFYCGPLVAKYVKEVMEFCLHTVVRNELEVDLRARVLKCITNFTFSNSEEVVNLDLYEPIINTIFVMMANDPDIEDENQEKIDYYAEGDEPIMMPSLMRAFEEVSLNCPTQQLMTQLFSLFSTALQRTHPPQPRRAIFLVIGCITAAIKQPFIPSILNLIIMGIQDQHRCIRNAAYFAFKELQAILGPEMKEFSPRLLSIFLDELRQIHIQLQLGQKIPQYTPLVYDSLDLLMANLTMEPYLSRTLEHLTDTIRTVSDMRIIVYSMSSICNIVYVTKEEIAPFRGLIMPIVKQCLFDPEQLRNIEERDHMRMDLGARALETWAGIIRNGQLGKNDPMLEEAMMYALRLIEMKTMIMVRSQVLSLISAVAKVVKEAMHCVFPKFIEHVFTALRIGDEDEDASDDDTESNMNRAICHCDSTHCCNKEWDTENDAIYCTIHFEAIYTMKEFCKYTGRAFWPYLERTTMAVFKLIDCYVDEIADDAMNALPLFLRALKAQKMETSLQHVLHSLMPKLINVAQSNPNPLLVSSAVKILAELLVEFKVRALPSNELRTSFGKAVINLMDEKCACHERECYVFDREYPLQLELEDMKLSVLMLIPVFGKCLPSQEFAHYMNKLLNHLFRKIEDTKNCREYEDFRELAYTTINECIEPLGSNAVALFNIILPKAIDATTTAETKLERQSAMALLGSLVYHVKEYSHQAFPAITTALQTYVERGTENIIAEKFCGCLARLIIVNASLVPLPYFLPILAQHTPIQENFEENYYILQSFNALMQVPDMFDNYFKHILTICFQVLRKREYTSDATFEIGFQLLRDMSQYSPPTFNEYIATSREAQTFINSLRN